MIRFKSQGVYATEAYTETVIIKTRKDLNKVLAVATVQRQASLNDVELLRNGCIIMNVRNHWEELIAYLNGEADEFTYRED